MDIPAADYAGASVPAGLDVVGFAGLMAQWDGGVNPVQVLRRQNP